MRHLATMHRWGALMTVMLAMAMLSSSAEAQSGVVRERSLDLFVGEQKVISAEDVAKYSLGAEGIVEVRLPEDGNEFVVVALTPGNTTLLLIMKSGQQIRYTVDVRQVRVTERDNVRLDFYFVELSREAGYRVGVGWPGTVAATVAVNANYNLNPRSLTSATASIATAVLPRLDLAQDSGWARVLREASIIVANGEKSMFESGGELNFRIESAVASSIQQIQFGSRIEVQPRYDRTTGRLDLKIAALVSELTAVNAEGLPGRTYTNLDTLVNLELGQSIILAGIHAKSTGRNSEGLPILSQIPVLGFLFGSQSQRETEVENLIFIVPTVVQAVALSDRDRVLEAQKSFHDYEGGVDGKTLYIKAMPRPVLDRKRKSKRTRSR